MRICARCRQPLDPRERPDDHLCLDDTPDPGDSSEDEPEAA